MRKLREWWWDNGGNLFDCFLVLMRFLVVVAFAGIFYFAMTA